MEFCKRLCKGWWFVKHGVNFFDSLGVDKSAVRYVYEYHKLTKALVVQDHRREIMADFSFFLQYSDDDIIQMNIQNWWSLWEIGGFLYLLFNICNYIGSSIYQINRLQFFHVAIN